MNLAQFSLRTRLAVLILVPLIIVSCIAVYWRFDVARKTSEDIFDRNLVMLSLAISRDVSNSGGDSLSETTARLLRDASGGRVFYHVYGPDGSFVTGYSSPPIGALSPKLENDVPSLFDAAHQGRPVRAARLAELVTVEGFSGTSVVTVWQDLSPRQNLTQALASRAISVAAALLATVAAVVAFGIRHGLRPLNDLEHAIQKRSPTDLQPIVRAIPIEARGIVDRLNNLFSEVTDAKAAQDRLISNAAHQLRNPVAAVHALAQATQAAKSPDDMKVRAQQLVVETRQTVRLTEQLLSLEQIKGVKPVLENCDVNTIVKAACERVAPAVLDRGIGFNVDLAHDLSPVMASAGMLGEAVANLIDNAVRHGADDVSQIVVSTNTTDQAAPPEDPPGIRLR
ncbi:MAG: sensor histidine kinase, partial [Pseudomonadota bacterium]